MFGICRPNASVRIIANAISRVPEIAVAIAIGLSIVPLVGLSELRRQLASHQPGEEALMRGTKIREPGAEPGSFNRIAARFADARREDVSRACPRNYGVGVSRGDKHPPLI